MVDIHRTRRRLVHRKVPARLTALEHDEFEGYASLFGVADSSGDVVMPGAFKTSLAPHKLARVRMLYQHQSHEPLGTWRAIREDGTGLYVKGRIVTSVQRGREVLSLIRAGALDGLSIGFRTQRARRDPARGMRLLLDIELWEISIVTFPLLGESRITNVGDDEGVAAEMRRAAQVLRA